MIPAPDVQIPELHGLRWQTDNATITQAQPSSVNCNTDVPPVAPWDGASMAVTESKYWQRWRLMVVFRKSSGQGRKSFIIN